MGGKTAVGVGAGVGTTGVNVARVLVAVSATCGPLLRSGRALINVPRIMLNTTSKLSTAITLSARPLYVRRTPYLLDPLPSTGYCTRLAALVLVSNYFFLQAARPSRAGCA